MVIAIKVNFAGGLVMALCLLALALSLYAEEPQSRPAKPDRPAEYPRIAMLWSPADGPEDRWANMARHDVIVMGIGQIGLRWQPHEFPAMSETIQPETIPAAIRNLKRIRNLNPGATVLLEVYFFEENANGYPPDHPWWLRDAQGQKVQFWPGDFRMDWSNPQYVSHVARRIQAVWGAVGDGAGIFLDNLRFDPVARSAWESLLGQVRRRCGDVPILVNAGWAREDASWVAPLINGLMYEDACRHRPETEKEPEDFYARIATCDLLLRPPRIGVCERFGSRADREAMVRHLLRTLAYTDMALLYADSTHGHHHDWYDLWDAPLGQAVCGPVPAVPGRLARREFAGGTVLWLPTSAEGPVSVKLPAPAWDLLSGREHAGTIDLLPGSGALLVGERPEGRARPGRE